MSAASTSDSCTSRHFSWLMKSCFPNPQHPHHPAPLYPTTAPAADTATISSLPDDLLLECLSRVPHSTLPSLPSVCRRWAYLLNSPAFHILRLRHHILFQNFTKLAATKLHQARVITKLHQARSNKTSPSSQRAASSQIAARISRIFNTISITNSALFAAALRFDGAIEPSWKVSSFVPSKEDDGGGFRNGSAFSLLSHFRLVSIGRKIYIIGRTAMLRCDTWTGTLVPKAGMTFPRKKFAAAAVDGRILVAGGCARSSVVEEYDPEENAWRVLSEAPRRRYGCIGASVDGVFYVIGGLKIGPSGNEVSARAPRAAGPEAAHVYASSMDLYDVGSRSWLRSRTVPGGGCVVAACAAGGNVFILSSHAVELSFWRFNASRKSADFGEWCRIRSPPLPAQVRLDSTVRFSCVGLGSKVALVQVVGCIDDLLRRSGRMERGLKEGLVLVYDCAGGEWSRAADMPQLIRRAACVCVEC